MIRVKRIYEKDGVMYCDAVCACGTYIYNILYNNINQYNDCGCGILAKCAHCGSPKVYAKGLCINCYHRLIRNGYVTPSREQIRESKERVLKDKEFKRKNRYAKYSPTTEIGIECKKLLESGMSVVQVANKFGYTRSYIYQLLAK